MTIEQMLGTMHKAAVKNNQAIKSQTKSNAKKSSDSAKHK